MPRTKLRPTDLKTELVSIDSLKPHPRNPRASDPARLAQSIGAHGQYRAIVVSSDGYILAGNHTWMGAIEAGQEQIWVHQLPLKHHDPQALEIMVVDNKASDDSKNEDGLLAELLREIRDEQGSFEGTLYEQDEAEKLLALLREDDPKPEEPAYDPNDIPAAPKVPVTKLGNVWLLGRHRLVCGDSTSPLTYKALMKGEEADFVFTSPPYNVDVKYSEHDDVESDWDQYQGFLAAVIGSCRDVLAAGRAIAWNIGTSPRTHPVKQAALFEELGLSYHRMLVWNKVVMPFPLWHAVTKPNPRARNFNPGYRHELVYIFTNGAIELGDAVEFGDLLSSDIFDLAPSGASKDLKNSDVKNGSQTLAYRASKEHPAAFPVELPAAFIDHLADKGAIVLDPFCGSGSTIIAAHRQGRRGYGIELDPKYCDVVCRRFQEQTGIMPALEATGELHDFIGGH